MYFLKHLSKHRVINDFWIKIFCRELCSSNYKNTLLLPTTCFRHKIKHQERRNEDARIEREAKFNYVYDYQREAKKKSEFVLHDGPPYANGDVHIGHAVNKILKDVTLRYQLLKGHQVHYEAGWDCHGLPIELKVLKENHIDGCRIDIRKRAYTFSQEAKEKQKHSFLEWGLLSNFNEFYITCDPKYIVKQLNVFQDLYDKGIIMRDHKPVFWSPHNRTSLAEAELEYRTDHVSPSVFVKFCVKKCPDAVKSKLASGSKLNILIWTTTPWSLPANQAVCYSPDKEYCVAISKEKEEFYIVALEMVPYLEKTLTAEFQVIQTFEGYLLKDFTYCHPLTKNRECPVIPAHHVTMDKGTGLVHMAPNHGLEDYIVAKKQSIPLDPCLVDESGCYNESAGADLVRQPVLEQGSKSVLDLLGNDILHLENYVHSYPYDWRSKTPVIIRSCHQWFLDVDRIRDKAIECLQTVKIIPEHFKKVFQNQLESCPQWCISRQRAWGVPIPAFYSSDTKKLLVHRDLTNHLCSLIEKEGIHCWWGEEINHLLPQSVRSQLNLGNEEFERGFDIMDIWFDSGISWKCVLPDPQISDICIEGVDQIRGWFNSSLLTSVALRGTAPYKSLLLHGFVTDSKGRKMSKSEGNVISPEDILNGSKTAGSPAYGVDVLRWWVAYHTCQAENVPVKMKIFEECAQNINKIRNVFKFLLSNVNQFDVSLHFIPSKELQEVDLYMLFRLHQFSQKIMSHYSQAQYKSVAREVLNFVTNDMSAFYCHLVKDRLYCDAEFSKSRLSCQTVLCFSLSTLMQIISPICPHLTEEVFCHSPYYNNNNFIAYEFPSLEEYLKDSAFPVSVSHAIEMRDNIFKAVNKCSHLEAIISCNPRISAALQNLNANSMGNSSLTEIFQVSDVSFEENPSNLPEGYLKINGNLASIDGVGDGGFSISLKETKMQKCPRCRLYKSNSVGNLCNRCSSVINVSSPSKESSVC